MSDFLPAIVALVILGACFTFGYLTDPYRHSDDKLQPAHGEANLPEHSHSSRIPEIG